MAHSGLGHQGIEGVACPRPAWSQDGIEKTQALSGNVRHNQKVDSDTLIYKLQDNVIGFAYKHLGLSQG